MGGSGSPRFRKSRALKFCPPPSKRAHQNIAPTLKVVIRVFLSCKATFYVGWTLPDKMSGKVWALCRNWPLVSTCSCNQPHFDAPPVPSSVECPLSNLWVRSSARRVTSVWFRLTVDNVATKAPAGNRVACYNVSDIDHLALKPLRGVVRLHMLQSFWMRLVKTDFMFYISSRIRFTPISGKKIAQNYIFYIFLELFNGYEVWFNKM